MYIVAIGWLYVAMMMSVAEATNTNGTVLGAIFTFLFYGLLPVALVVYILSTPARKRARAERVEREAAVAAAATSVEPDRGGETPADAVPPVRKEP